jgi:hypothetical protein
MIRRLSETERTLALQRLEAVNARIADLEAGIQRLRQQGLPTVEAERMLRLARRSHAVMRRCASILADDKT